MTNITTKIEEELEKKTVIFYGAGGQVVGKGIRLNDAKEVCKSIATHAQREMVERIKEKFGVWTTDSFPSVKDIEDLLTHSDNHETLLERQR